MKWSYFLFSLVGATVLSGSLLLSSPTSATSTSANASVTVGSACSLTSSGNNSHTATISPGTYTPDIGSTTITVTCNDPGGYALYAIGYTNDEYGTTTLNGASSGQTIATGTNTGSSGNSNWAMKLTPVTGTYAPTIENSFSSYHAVPSTYTKVASFASVTDMGSNATGSKLTTTYAAFIKGDQAADTYAGKVKYTMVHPNTKSPVVPLSLTDCPANKICYAPNANNIIGSMDSISSTKITSSPTAGVQAAGSNSTIKLVAPNYSRIGYGLAGWSPDFRADSDSIIYGPNESITTSTSGSGDVDVSSNGLILYPVWIASSGNIQNWTGCSVLMAASSSSRATLSSVTALKDQRDGNVYTVARLSDGNCWMAENLRLENYSTTGNNAALAQGYGGVFAGLADSELLPSLYSSTATSNTMYSTNGDGGTIMISGDYFTERIPRYYNGNTDRSFTAKFDGGNEDHQWYAYGNYYTWAAVMANTTPFSDKTSSDSANTSLCPNGWRLPRGGNKDNEANNDYWNLVVVNINGGVNPNNYSGQSRPYYSGSSEASVIDRKIRSFPNNGIHAGGIYSVSIYSRGTSSDYWTSSSTDYWRAYKFSYNNNNVYPGTSYTDKYTGLPVRCMIDVSE